MKKIVLTILPIIFTAQACNILLGGLGGEGQGSGSRGVFYSTDGGQSWQETNRTVDNKSLDGAQISRIVFDKVDSKNIMALSFNAGIYATTVGGEKWFPLLPKFSGFDAFISPTNRQQIYAAGTRNDMPVILKTSDSGQTWIQIYSEPVRRAAVTALAFDPLNSSVMYAGLSSGTVLRSVNFGVKWNMIGNFRSRIMKLTVSPDAKFLYMLTKSLGLYRTQDGGRTWISLPVSEKPAQYNDLVMESNNSQVIYLATDKGIFKSSDGGSSWIKFLLPASPDVNNVAAVAINPQNARQIFAAIRATTYRSDDGGGTWSTHALATNRQISSIVVDPNEPNKVFVGLK